MAKTRKDIDKDLMYKKLMPSNFKPAKSAMQESTAAEPEAQAAEQKAEPVQLEPPRKAAHRDVAIPYIDSQKTALVNLMESAVFEKFDSVIARFNCCKCDRCKKDIMALALNKLPSRYMVLTEGRYVPELDKQLNAQVMSAMIQAVLQVRSHPRH